MDYLTSFTARLLWAIWRHATLFREWDIISQIVFVITCRVRHSCQSTCDKFAPLYRPSVTGCLISRRCERCWKVHWGMGLLERGFLREISGYRRITDLTNIFKNSLEKNILWSYMYRIYGWNTAKENVWKQNTVAAISIQKDVEGTSRRRGKSVSLCNRSRPRVVMLMVVVVMTTMSIVVFWFMTPCNFIRS